MNGDFIAAITHEDSLYGAPSLDIEATGEGKKAKEALSNLKEGLELYFEDLGPR